MHTIFLRQCMNGWHLCLSQVVPCYPEPGNAAPKRTWKGRQRMEEAIVDNLVEEPKPNIRHEAQDDLGHRELGQKILAETHRVNRGSA